MTVEQREISHWSPQTNALLGLRRGQTQSVNKQSSSAAQATFQTSPPWLARRKCRRAASKRRISAGQKSRKEKGEGPGYPSSSLLTCMRAACSPRSDAASCIYSHLWRAAAALLHRRCWPAVSVGLPGSWCPSCRSPRRPISTVFLLISEPQAAKPITGSLFVVLPDQSELPLLILALDSLGLSQALSQ